MGLTDVTIRNAKPSDKPMKLSDSGGLFLFVTPAGGRFWRLKYRIGGREKLLSIGPYPLIGLRDARTARDEAKRQILGGMDPAIAKRRTIEEASQVPDSTFRSVSDEYCAKLIREGRATGTMDKIRWYLTFANPVFGNRSIGTIKAAEVLQVLRGIESRGRHETARKARATIGAVFRYAIATGRADNDPTGALKGALTRPVVKPRAAITEASAFAGLLRAVWGYEGAPETVAALKLMALLHPRPGELRQASWIEFDFGAGVWTIPPSRMKMRRPHRLPLAPQSIQILTELQEAARPGALVFPSVRSTARCMSENTLNGALRRLGFMADQATSHGFRASFSTIANESGLWHPDAIERDLAHVESSAVRRAYARGEHWEERVRMAAWWADQCDAMRVGR